MSNVHAPRFLLSEVFPPGHVSGGAPMLVTSAPLAVCTQTLPLVCLSAEKQCDNSTRSIKASVCVRQKLAKSADFGKTGRMANVYGSLLTLPRQMMFGREGLNMINFNSRSFGFL